MQPGGAFLAIIITTCKFQSQFVEWGRGKTYILHQQLLMQIILIEWL